MPRFEGFEQHAKFDARSAATNPFLLEATPELLDRNTREWIDFFDAQGKHHGELMGWSDYAERVCRAKEIVGGWKMNHVVDGRMLPRIMQEQSIQSNSRIQAQHDGGIAVGVSNTYDMDEDRGLADFVFLGVSSNYFRAHRGTAIAFEFDQQDILKLPQTFFSFEDFVFAQEAQKYHGVPDAWRMYLAENFKGADFPEIISRFLAASYKDPGSYDKGDNPNKRCDRPGFHFGRSRPQFEVKVLDTVPLDLVKGIRCKTDDGRLIKQLTDLGLDEGLFIHDERFF